MKKHFIFSGKTWSNDWFALNSHWKDTYDKIFDNDILIITVIIIGQAPLWLDRMFNFWILAEFWMFHFRVLAEFGMFYFGVLG